VASPAQSNVIRFGTYEFAQFAGELRKGGIRVRLEGQPLAILGSAARHSEDTAGTSGGTRCARAASEKALARGYVRRFRT
jgi:hypothetical protein